MFNLLRYFRSEPEALLAQEMANQLAANIPPKLMDQRRQVLSAKKIARILEQVIDRAKQHQLKVGLGLIRRAILANKLKWELKSKGYPQDFIDVAIEGLLIELAKK